MKIVVSVVIVLLLLILGLFLLVHYSLRNVKFPLTKEFFEGITTSSENIFLSNTDFTKGDWALYVSHPELGEFMVLDKEVLEANKDSLIIETVPIFLTLGRGSASDGFMLFNNNQRISSHTGSISKIEIGSLHNYAIPVKNQSYNGTKKEIVKMLGALEKNKKVFITFEPNFRDFIPENRAFKFRIHFPTIAVPLERENNRIVAINGFRFEEPSDSAAPYSGHKYWLREQKNNFEEQIQRKIRHCIKKYVSTKNYQLDIFYDSNDYAIFDTTSDQFSNWLKTEKGWAFMEDFVFFNFSVHISTGKVEAESLYQLNYTDCIDEKTRNRDLLLKKNEGFG